MERALLVNEAEEKAKALNTTWGVVFEEVERVCRIAGPMAFVNLSQYFLMVISEMMVGHFGELYLSSTAIAISFCAVTGFSLIFGMACALDTLCGQAYGAQQYRRLGIHLHTAIFCLILTCFPLSIVWHFMGRLLILLGQDPLISQEAGKFAMWLIPALFAYATLQSLIKYFQAQSLVTPLIITSCLSIGFHICVSWALVFKFGLGTTGAALAIGISYGLNAILLGLYMQYSSACAKTRAPISMQLFQGIGEFFHFAIPFACMACFQWWAYEFLTLLSGRLPNPKLEASVLSVCLAIASTLYTIPDGLGVALSIRVANEFGAGRPQAAYRALSVVIFLAVSAAIILSSIFFASRNVFGYIFSDEEEVVEYIANMAPLVCLNIIVSSCQAVFSGVARGSGWQDLAAYVSLAAFYLCGIPVAAILAFWLQLRGKGLWIGIITGAFVQSLLLLIITCCQNWEKQASKARERIFEGRAVKNDGSASRSLDELHFIIARDYLFFWHSEPCFRTGNSMFNMNWLGLYNLHGIAYSYIIAVNQSLC